MHIYTFFILNRMHLRVNPLVINEVALWRFQQKHSTRITRFVTTGSYAIALKLSQFDPRRAGPFQWKLLFCSEFDYSEKSSLMKFAPVLFLPANPYLQQYLPPLHHPLYRSGLKAQVNHIIISLWMLLAVLTLLHILLNNS